MTRADRVARIVAEWSPGLHQEHLREILGCDQADQKVPLMIAYRRKAVDFCRAYVVVPVPAAASERAA